MNPTINPLALIAATPMSTNKSSNSQGGTAWFEAMSQAWGQALDNQASQIQQKSDALTGGNDTPSAVTALTTESLRMSFLSNSAHTSISTVGQAIETMARKQ